MKNKLRSSAVLIGTALAGAVSCGTQAQMFPQKPIKLLVPFAAGSGGDVATRIASVPLGEALGQPLVIDNRAGAGGSLVADLTAKSAPDGYTLMIATAGALVYRPFLVKNVPYDGIRDFTPVGIVGDTAGAILVSNALPASNMRELIEYAKANPGKLSYGTSGVGTNHHLSMEQIQVLTGARLVHVPYKAANQAMLDVMTGQIPIAFTIIGPAVPQIKAGKLRAFALDSEKRNARAPDVPSIREAVPAFESPPAWMAMFGPANMPPALTRRINAEMNRVIAQSAVRGKLEEIGFDVVAVSPEEFAAVVRRNVSLAEKMIKAAGIEPE